MDDHLIIGLICAHFLIRDLLADSLIQRGHEVIAVDFVPIHDHSFKTIHTRISPCSVIVVCAWGMPRRGHHLIRHLRAVDPRRRVVLIETTTEHELSDQALRAGAVAVIGATTGSVETLESIESAARGDSMVRMSSIDDRGGSSPADPDALTQREVEVLQLVVDGFDVRRISDLLFISSKTVKHHLSSIYAKLDTSNRTDAVLRALRRGLVALGDR